MAAFLDQLKKKVKKSLDDFNYGVNNINPAGDTNPNEIGNQNLWTTQAAPTAQKMITTVRNAGNDVVQKYTLFADPTSNNGSNFWSSPAASVMAGNTQLPKIRLKPLSDAAETIKNPVLKFGADTGIGMTEDLLNTPRNLLQAPINIARDVNTGETDPRKYAGDVAPFAEGVLNIGTLGGGTVAKGVIKQGFKQGLKEGVKRGAIEGVKYGGAYGALSGLESGRNIEDSGSYAGNLAMNTGTGMVGGAVIGGLTGGISGAAKEGLQKTIKSLFPHASDGQVAQMTDEYVKTAPQRIYARTKSGQFSTGDAKPFIPAGRDYAVPRSTPMKVTHWMDRVDQELLNNVPQPGLSIKVVNRSPVQRSLSEALGANDPQKVHFGTLSQSKFDQINKLLTEQGKLPLESKDIYVYPNVIKKLQDKRLSASLNPDTLADIAYSAVHGDSKVLQSKYPQNVKMIKIKANKGMVNTAIVGEHKGAGSLKTVYPDSGMKKALMEGGTSNPSSGLIEDAPQSPVSAAQKSSVGSIPQSTTDAQMMNDFMQGKVKDTMTTKPVTGKLPVTKDGKILLTKTALPEDVSKQNIDEFFNNLPTSAIQKIKNYARNSELEKKDFMTKQREKMDNLMNYNRMLAKQGYSSEQISTINAGQARKILENKVRPEDYTPELRSKFQSELDAQYNAENLNHDLPKQQWNQEMADLRKRASEEMGQKAQKTTDSTPSEDPSWITDNSPLTPVRDVLQKQNEAGKIGSTLPSSKDLQAFDREISKKGIDVKTKVGVLDKFRTPDRVLRKIGLGKEADELRGAYDNYLKELPVELDRITEWSKRVDSKDSARTIFQYLDGQKVNLSANDHAIAEEIKGYLKNWADRLGLPEDGRVSNYITHIFEQDFLQKEFDPELAKLIRDKVAGSVYDPFTQERLGKQGYIEDVWQALDAYVKRGTRKANLDPTLTKIKDISENLEDSQFKYVKNYIDKVNMRPTEMDNAIDISIKQSPIGYKFGQRPVTAITRGLRQMGYRGALGLNIGSALRNLSQGANTYAKLGEKYTVLGYMKMLSSGKQELEKVGVLRDELIQDRTINATKKFWEKTDKRLFYFFEGAERINRGAAYFGAKLKALDQGMSEEQAIEYGKKIVRDTQFTFGSVDTPQVLQSDLAKTILQFQSYNLKQAEFLAEMVKNKEFAGLARWTVASLAFTYTLGQLIGMKPADIIPFSGIWTGQTKIGETPAIQAVGKLKDAAFGGKDKYGNDLTLQDRAGKAIDAVTPMFPGGVQFKKTLQGLDAVRKGYSESASGRVQYMVPEDPGTAIRAGVFGKSNLPQAQEYFNKDRTPLSDKQTAAFKALSTDEKQSYMDSIYGQRESSKLLDEIKKRLEKGENADDLIKKASAAETTPVENTVKLKAQEDIAKQKVDTLGGVQTVGNKIFFNDKGSVKTIDLSAPTKGEGIDAFANQNWNINKALEVYGANLPSDKKEEVYKKLGVDGSSLEYAYKARKSVDIKTQYTISQAKTLTHDQLLERMKTGRVESVAGDMFITDKVLDNLRGVNLLSDTEVKLLKKMKFDKNGNPIAKKTGSKGIIIKETKMGKRVVIKPAKVQFTPIKLTRNGKINLQAPARKKQAKIKIKTLTMPKTKIAASYR